MNSLLQEKIFDKCVKVYLVYGKPVGSKLLRKKCFKNLGESTVRWYLNKLVRDGYLENISDFSGRVPTDFGWRQFYINNLRKIKIDGDDYLNFEKKDLSEKINLILQKNKVYYLLKEKDGHLEEGGLDFILENIEFEHKTMIYYFANFLKILKRNIRNFIKNVNEDLALYIGKEIPLKSKESSYFSIILKKIDNQALCFISLKRQNYPYFVQLIDKLFNERGTRKTTTGK